LICLHPAVTFAAGKIRRRFESESLIGNVLIDEENEYTFLTKTGVKCIFAHPPFSVPREVEFHKGIMMPRLRTLAAMKAYTLGRRNKWKDYVDLYFLLRDSLSFREVVVAAEEMFPSEFSEKLFRVQLMAFDDINYSEEVMYVPGKEVAQKDVELFLQTRALDA
jgi:hypothetical protein